MSMKYVNTTYGTVFKRGMLVVYTSPNAKHVLYRVVSATHLIRCTEEDSDQRWWFHPRDLLPVIECACGGSGRTVDDVGPRVCEICNGRGYHVLTWEQYRDVKS
ncbi:MAG: hypothetical protein IPK52_22150 [Chloroflexi bacterium]|nr:hypothetical protein [Chloroflexota bacterium]